MGYISIKQVSEKWNLSIRTIKEYCKNDIISDFKIEHGEYLIGDSLTNPIVKRGRKKNVKFTFIDLFCGIGGFHQAMAKLGGKCVFACDINEKCREVYNKNYNWDKSFKVDSDISNAIKDNSIPVFDVLCGGFPCQTFSKAGKRKGFDIVEDENGEKDERGQLFFRIIDILNSHPECKYIVLENVRNLADNKDNWKIVCDELK